MEQAPQGAGQQQSRPQPVYDIRNGGHYGSLSAFSLISVALDNLINLTNYFSWYNYKANYCNTQGRVRRYVAFSNVIECSRYWAVGSLFRTWC
jgi:hypothetical protein